MAVTTWAYNGGTRAPRGPRRTTAGEGRGDGGNDLRGSADGARAGRGDPTADGDRPRAAHLLQVALHLAGRRVCRGPGAATDLYALAVSAGPSRRVARPRRRGSVSLNWHIS